MSSLRSLVDELAGEDLDLVSDAKLAGDLVELRREIDRLEAQWLRRLAAFDGRGAAAVDGSGSTPSWLRRHCRLAPGAARERVDVARSLDRTLTATGAALADGEISYRHAALISTTTARVPEPIVADAEAILLEAARRLDPRQLGYAARHLRHTLDPDGSLADANAAYERRWFTLSPTWQGMVALDGMLDPEAGARLITAINALAAPRPGDTRSAAQRRADALVEMADRHLAGGDLPQTGGERPHVNVVIPFETLLQRTGARGADLDWVGPITADTARRLACDAGLARIITIGDSEPLDLGRRTRVVSPALRRALLVRDQHCVFPGCDRPWWWCDGHHLQHWANGGETSLTNLALLCRAHHRAVHEGGWHLRRDPTAGWCANRGQADPRGQPP